MACLSSWFSHMSKPVLSGRLAKWVLLLQQFKIIYVIQKIVKRKILIDFLGNHSIPNNWEFIEDLLNEVVLFINSQKP